MFVQRDVADYALKSAAARSFQRHNRIKTFTQGQVNTLERKLSMPIRHRVIYDLVATKFFIYIKLLDEMEA